MECSTPGFPVHHQLPELAQTHVHRISDAIQSSHPVLFPIPSAFNLFQHQGLFQGVSSSHQVTTRDTEMRKSKCQGSSLVVQWLGLCTFTARGLGSIPGRGTKILQAICQGKKNDSTAWKYIQWQLTHPYLLWPKDTTTTLVLDSCFKNDFHLSMSLK